MSSPAEKTTSGGGMSMNTVTTVMAFSVSAFFVLFIFVRLLCARIHLRAGHSAAAAAAAHGDAFPAFSVERGIRGLEPTVVTSFPTAKFGDGSRPRAAALQESRCPVCLEEYEAKDVVRVLPSCGHAFHVACIDAWLRQHSTCPVCRASLRAAAYAKHRPAAAMLPPPVHCPPAAATPMRAAFRQQHQQQQLSTASSSSDADAFQPAAADRLEIVVSDEPVPSAAAGQAEHPHPHPHPATAAAIDR